MVFWCQYVDIVFPQCLLVVLIQQNLSAIFSKQINQIKDDVEYFKYFRLHLESLQNVDSVVKYVIKRL